MNHWLGTEFKDAFPVACIMKHRLPHLWMRVHSLPESKRYPDTDEEREMVITRYTQFGTALLGTRAPCCIVRSQFRDADLDPKKRGILSWTPLPSVRESEEEQEPDGDIWYCWYAQTSWEPDSLRALLLDIAEERDSDVSFVSKASGNIFAPYDGGADGFSFDSRLLTRLRHEFQPCLSLRDDSL